MSARHHVVYVRATENLGLYIFDGDWNGNQNWVLNREYNVVCNLFNL
jgi:hypothetical protein